jgi:hypothetical protein
MARLKAGEHAIFVIRASGSESFKGSGFVRGGLYDRVQIRQGQDAFTFRDLDSLNLYGVHAPGAPAFTESAIFILRSPAFSAAFPWKFTFLGNRVDRETGVPHLYRLRQRILARREFPRRRPARGQKARRRLAAGVEDARRRDRPLLGAAARGRRRLCAARPPHPTLDAQEQVAGERCSSTRPGSSASVSSVSVCSRSRRSRRC